MMTKQEVIDFLTNGFQLANLPLSFTRLRQIANDAHSDLQDVVEVAREDQQLSASLLRLANSSLYSKGSEQAISIEDAVQKIGLKKVVEHSLALGIVNRIDVKHENFDVTSFWRRSIIVGRIAEEILDVAPKLLRTVVDRQHLYTAGLLHDIGLLALIEGFPGEMYEIFDCCAAEKRPLYQIERRVFGFTHQDVGRILFKKWSLPEELQCVAGYHHEPLELQRRLLYPLVDLINISDYLCCLCETDNAGVFRPELIEEVWKRNGISFELAEELKLKVQAAFSDADAILAC